MKNIKYKTKNTSATTIYRDTSTSDTKWILAQAKRLVDIAAACEKHGIKEGDRLNQRNPKIPRQGTGRVNTPASLCEGIIDNFNGSQYDLSEKQCNGLEEAFRIGEEIIEDFESVEFEEVAQLPKLNASVAKSIDNPVSTESTLGDFFEIDSITVTYKRK